MRLGALKVETTVQIDEFVRLALEERFGTDEPDREQVKQFFTDILLIRQTELHDEGRKIKAARLREEAESLVGGEG